MGGGPVGLGRGGDLDHDSDQKAWRHLEQHIAWLWPHLSGVAITHRWGGPSSVTMDLTPALGYLDGDRTAVYGLGCIGDGVAMSYLNGEVLADLLTSDGDGETSRQCPFVNRRVIPWPEPAATAARYAIRGSLQAEDAFHEHLPAGPRQTRGPASRTGRASPA
jgi:glycine/D-amino acid oxidase-like deaminating enzyme